MICATTSLRALEVLTLTVEITEMPASSGSSTSIPTFRVLAGVLVWAQFVDEDDLKLPGQYGRNVEFKTAAAVASM